MRRTETVCVQRLCVQIVAVALSVGQLGGLEAPASTRTELNEDLDGDGLVSKKERKLFGALDADGDG